MAQITEFATQDEAAKALLDGAAKALVGSTPYPETLAATDERLAIVGDQPLRTTVEAFAVPQGELIFLTFLDNWIDAVTAEGSSTPPGTRGSTRRTGASRRRRLSPSLRGPSRSRAPPPRASGRRLAAAVRRRQVQQQPAVVASAHGEHAPVGSQEHGVDDDSVAQLPEFRSRSVAQELLRPNGQRQPRCQAAPTRRCARCRTGSPPPPSSGRGRDATLDQVAVAQKPGGEARARAQVDPVGGPTSSIRPGSSPPGGRPAPAPPPGRG